MTCLGDIDSLYELKLIMKTRLAKYKSNNNVDTTEMDNMIELLNDGIEMAEYNRLRAEWLEDEIKEWEVFS